jgi:hypothetical protein
LPLIECERFLPRYCERHFSELTVREADSFFVGTLRTSKLTWAAAALNECGDSRDKPSCFCTQIRKTGDNYEI